MSQTVPAGVVEDLGPVQPKSSDTVEDLGPIEASSKVEDLGPVPFSQRPSVQASRGVSGSWTPASNSEISRQRLAQPGFTADWQRRQEEAGVLSRQKPAPEVIPSLQMTEPGTPAAEVTGSPLIPLKHLPAQIASGITGIPSEAIENTTLGKAAAGFAGKVEGLTSLEGAGLTGAAIAEPALGLVFIPGMSKDAAEETSAAIDEAKKGNWNEAAGHIGGAMASAAGATMGALHVAGKLSGARTAPEAPVEAPRPSEGVLEAPTGQETVSGQAPAAAPPIEDLGPVSRDPLAGGPDWTPESPKIAQPTAENLIRSGQIAKARLDDMAQRNAETVKVTPVAVADPEPTKDFAERQVETEKAIEQDPFSDMLGLRTKQVVPGKVEDYVDAGAATRNLFGRHGVHQLEEHFPESADALTKAVKSRDYARFNGESEYRLISKAMGDASGKEAGRQAFNEVMIDSQLKGMQDYYTKEGEPEKAAQVQRLMSDEDLSKAVASPNLQAAKAIWDNGMGRDMREAHVANGGARIEHVGPAGSYFPLVADEVGSGASGSKIPMQPPKAPGTQHRTGLSEAYDTSSQAIIGNLKNGADFQYGRYPAALRANNIGLALEQFKKDGIMKDVAPGERPPAFVDLTIDGQTKRVAATVLPTRRGNVLMPTSLAKEVTPALTNLDRPAMTKLGRAVNMPTQFAVTGIAEPIGHGANIAQTLSSKGRMIDFGAGDMGNAALNLPGVKQVAGIIKSITDNPRSPENIELLRQAYDDGVFAPRTPFGRSPGALLISRMDTNARLMLYKSALEYEPNATPARLREVVRQLGEYAAQLSSADVRSLKTGPMANLNLSPFVTAGKTMGLNAAEQYGGPLGMGTAPIGGGGMANRLSASTTRGIIGVTAAWVAAYKATTGKYPWDDKNMKLFQVPVPQSWRQTDVGKNLWGDKPGQAYINFGNTNFAARGARYLGIRGFLETLARGGHAGQGLEEGAKDVINTQVQPYMGPPIQAATRFANFEPQLKSLRNDKGQLSPQVWTIDKDNPKPGVDTVRAGMERVLRGLNPTERMILEDTTQHPGTGIGRIIADTLRGPIGVSGPSNVQAQAAMLRKAWNAAGKSTRNK